jgi:hypothetical protein
MKTFSDDIVSTDTLKASILDAFQKQNAYFAAEVVRVTRPMLITLSCLVVFNVVALTAIVYKLYV